MKTGKKHLGKIILTVFYLLIIGYSQEGYAGIEKRLYVDNSDGREYVAISVCNDVVTPEMAKEIATMLLDKSHPVGSLFISKAYFEVESVAIIAGALLANPILKEVCFLRNSFSEEKSKQMMMQLLRELKELTILNIIEDFDGSDEEMIYNFLVNKSKLVELNLRKNKITGSGAKIISKFLRESKTLQILDLRQNHIDNMGAVAIARALEENRTLFDLDIRGNNIETEGLQTIIDALVHNVVMQRIEADWSPKQRVVVKLILERNKLIKQMAGKIRELLRKVDMSVLSGNHPRVGQDSPLSLLDANVLREIVTYYHESELDIIMNFTDVQLVGFTVEEREIIERIRGLQGEIVRLQHVIEPQMAGLERIENTPPSTVETKEIPLKRRRLSDEEQQIVNAVAFIQVVNPVVEVPQILEPPSLQQHISLFFSGYSSML